MGSTFATARSGGARLARTYRVPKRLVEVLVAGVWVTLKHYSDRHMTVLVTTEHTTESLDAERGAEAARLIWDDAPEAEAIIAVANMAVSHRLRFVDRQSAVRWSLSEVALERERADEVRA